MSDFDAMRALLVAGELFAISSLILAAAWLASREKAASFRHLIWSAAFASLVLLPVLVALLPGSIVLSVPAPAPVLPADFSVASLSDMPVAAPSPSLEIDTTTILMALGGLWLAGLGLIALRGLFATLVLRAMRRDAIANPFEASELPDFARNGGYELLVSNAERGPVTWGFLRPVVLLPRRALYWPGERLQAVLLHELAHIRRRDSLMQMLSLIACALYWPNPLVWIAARTMRREAEMATDDAVLSYGVRASDYASELVQIAAEIRTRPLSPFTPMHMAEPSALEARVQSVLAPTSKRAGVTKMDVLKMTAAALLATTALVLARPSLAQDAPAPVETAPLPPVTPADAATPAPVADADAAPAPVAQADVPAPPSPPDATMAPPPPPPPPPHAPVAQMAPLPPLPALPHARNVSIRSETHRVHGHNVRHVWVTIDGVAQTAAAAKAAIARIQPEIDRAAIQVRASEQAMRAAEAEQARVAVQVQQKMARVQPQIQAAMARAQAAMAKAHIAMDVQMRMRLNDATRRARATITAHAHEADGPDVVVEDDSDQGVSDQDSH